MKFQCYASGSTGNLYTASNDSTTIMIECGITYNKINNLLDYTLHSVDSCLVSHYHQDHCKAYKEIAKAGIDVYMSEETKEALGATGHRIHTITPKIQFRVKDFTILPFETEHVEGSLGFVIKCELTKEKLLFITDSFYCRYKFKNLTQLAVECNYSEELLKQNITDGITDKARLKSIQRSHFSLEHIKDFLLANDLTKVTQIYLLHLSSSNANANFIKEEVQKATGKEIIIC